MAKRRSKIKLGGRAPLRGTRSQAPLSRTVLSRKLTRQLDSNLVEPCGDETCSEGSSIHEDEVKSSDVINTETATAELGDKHSGEHEHSSEDDADKPTKMKKSPTPKAGRAVQSEKAPSTCPREIDGDLCLDVECGNNTAVLNLAKLCVGSKGACIEHDGAWLTPNEFQFVSGRETAKDWKRSIRHNGFSLKVLIVNGHIELNAAAAAPVSPAAAPTTTTTNNNNSSSSNKPEKVVKEVKIKEVKAKEVKSKEVKAKEVKSKEEGVENKRRYIPVKRRNGVVKDKVGGRRKKIRRAKKALGNRAVAGPTAECPQAESPDVADGNKENVDTTPCPSKDAKLDVDDVTDDITDHDESLPVDEEKEDKGSEAFFKTLNLSKTPRSSPSPVNLPTIATDLEHKINTALEEHVEIEKSKISATIDDTTNEKGDIATKLENAVDATPKVVATFRSRLIADDTRLRIAINREVVSKKDDNKNQPEVKLECNSDWIDDVKLVVPALELKENNTLVGNTVEHKTEISNVTPVGSTVEHKTEISNVTPVVCTIEHKTEISNVTPVGSTVEHKTETSKVKSETVKTETVEEITLKEDTMDKPNIVTVDAKSCLDGVRPDIVEKRDELQSEILNANPVIASDNTATVYKQKSEDTSRAIAKQTEDSKCPTASDDIRSEMAKCMSESKKLLSEHAHKSHVRTHTATTSAESVKPSTLLLKSCYKHASTMVPCDCVVNGVKDKQLKEANVSKPVSTDSGKCHRKAQELKNTSAKPVTEQTFQDKTQYENEMLELMSVYRPVMVPCDGRCPYVCPETTGIRNGSGTPSPYNPCQTNKWPMTSPLMSGVMTPEMMYYMTQQLYLDMYNTSLYAQCASSGGNKHSSDKYIGDKHSGDKQSVDKHNGDKHSADKRIVDRHSVEIHSGERHSGERHNGERHNGERHSGEKHGQSKPVKRKVPEQDPDLPLDLSVKRAKLDNEKPKASHTQDNDSPIDFSKKSSYSFEKKVPHTSKQVAHHTTHNGSFKSNGYKAKQSSPFSGSNMCTCRKTEDIRTWNVDKVCSFLKQYHDCAIYTKTFRDQGIDGRLLPYLTMQHLTRTLGMQTGPAITFLDAVDQQLRGNTQRQCQWCKV